MENQFFKHQHEKLVDAVNSQPSLGKPLAWHASPIGLKKLIEAVKEEWLDPIAMNHGIKRYCIENYDADLIWDYPGIDMRVSFDDPFIRDLNKNFEEIKAEIMNIIDLVKKFPDSDDLTNSAGQWNFIPFFEKDGSANTKVLDQCPKITSAFSSQKVNTELGFAFVSVLTSQSTIAAHSGSSALRKRYHLPIQVPEVDKSKIRIGPEWISWEPGKAFSFYDAVEHEVIHDSDGERILLIVDVWPDSLPISLIDYIQTHNDLLKYATDGRQSVAVND